MGIDNRMQREQWFVIPVNPQPWTVPPFQPGMKNGHMYVSPGRDVKGGDFKDAVREEIIAQGAYMMKPPYKIEFWFEHKLESDTSKEVDATNMQKLAEDALQGVVIDNDRHVKVITSHNFDQNDTANVGMFLIHVVDNVPEPGIPMEIFQKWAEVRNQLKLNKAQTVKEIKDANTWP